ncbi:unnamed protein product [Nesidiocoris tenuis]|uniref:Uncharacterized protein n=1 Tax=Nesidiocoris tenuis TaxID=355587 RepID=A0A6H5GS63_9HEMI|nr:unnamed protein product [Nesidiocoris tenuis]
MKDREVQQDESQPPRNFADRLHQFDVAVSIVLPIFRTNIFVFFQFFGRATRLGQFHLCSVEIRNQLFYWPVQTVCGSPGAGRADGHTENVSYTFSTMIFFRFSIFSPIFTNDDDPSCGDENRVRFYNIAVRLADQIAELLHVHISRAVTDAGNDNTG